MTHSDMVRIYISSTISDLSEERDAAMAHLRDADLHSVHSYGAANIYTISESCLADIDSCDVYLLILGHRYGGRPAENNPEGLSYTHLEFRHALAIDRPILAFLKAGDTYSIGDGNIIDRDDALAFRREVSLKRKAEPFKDKEEFVRKMLASLLKLSMHQRMQRDVHCLDPEWIATFLRQVRAVRPGLPANSLTWRIENFCKAQLSDDASGKSDPAIPFVGRGAIFDRLNAWLDEPAASRRALVIGSAGSGKSTLLVRWLLPFISGPDTESASSWKCVFVPISRRFGTHGMTDWLQLLCVRLATELGCEVSEAVRRADNTSMLFAELNQLCKHAMSESARVLIVVDGIDEATGGAFDAGWFPSDAPEHLRLVVSARFAEYAAPERWLEALNWETNANTLLVTVGPLSRADVRALLDRGVLRILDAAELDRIAAAVMRLSNGGDPILCRYLLPELQGCIDGNGHFDAPRAANWEVGLTGFFKRWLGDIRDFDLKSVRGGTTSDSDRLALTLAVLAGAKGGALPGAALDQLVSLATGTKARVSDADLDVLSRWVLRTDSYPGAPHNVGYVLAHPRLNEFIEKTFPRNHETASAAFAEWCNAAVAHCIDPAVKPGVATYLVNWASAHLAESRPKALWELLSRQWKSLSVKHARSLRLFSRDVDLCLEYALGTGPIDRDWPRVIGCQIMRSSIDQREPMPARLPAALVHHGVLTLDQARDWLPGNINCISWSREDRSLALAAANLAQAMPLSDKVDLAAHFLRLVTDNRPAPDSKAYTMANSWCFALVDLASQLTVEESAELKLDLEAAALDMLWWRDSMLDFGAKFFYLLPRVRALHLAKLLRQVLQLNHDAWWYVGFILERMPRAESTSLVESLVRRREVPDDAVGYLLPWLPAGWAAQRSQAVRSLLDVAGSSYSSKGAGNAVSLMRHAVLGSAAPDMALAEMAFAIASRTDNTLDQLFALGHLLHHSSGAFRDRVLQFTLNEVLESRDYDDFTRFSGLAEAGAFSGHDVGPVVALAEGMPRASGLEVIGFVADGLTSVLAARTWQIATMGRIGDTAAQALCKSLFWDVMTNAEREAVVAELCTGICEQVKRQSLTLGAVPAGMVPALADALLAALADGRLDLQRLPYGHLIHRAPPSHALRIVDAAAAASPQTGSRLLDRLVEALQCTTEHQLPAQAIIDRIDAALDREEADAGLRSYWGEKVARALADRQNESPRPQRQVGAVGANGLEAFSAPGKDRKAMLESLYAAAEAWHSIDIASRREAHDAICQAFTVFP